MELAPPPQPGSRIQDLGDRLVVRFRPHRFWGQLIFLSVWLAFWTFGGVAAFGELARSDWGSRTFPFFWLCMWGAGEATVMVAIAFQLFGRELLVVTAQQLEERKELGRFARTKVYDSALVQDVRAARTPTDEGERKDYCLQVVYDGKKIRVGEGMQEREAEYVASTVLERIRPRPRWSDEGWRNDTHVEPVDVTTRSRSKAGIVGSLVFPAIVIAALVWLGVQTATSHSPKAKTSTSARAIPVGPPATQEFSDAREYASAMTLYSLTSGQSVVLGKPDCGAYVTWTAWVCRVSAKSLDGPFAGRRLVYRCYPQVWPQPSGRPRVQGILCGPEHPPPITGTAGS